MKKMRLNVSPDGRIINMDGANIVPILKQPFQYQQQTTPGQIQPGGQAIQPGYNSMNNACILNNLTKYYQTSVQPISSAATAASINAAGYATAQPLMTPSIIPGQGHGQPLQPALLAQTSASAKEPSTGIIYRLSLSERFDL